LRASMHQCTFYDVMPAGESPAGETQCVRRLRWKPPVGDHRFLGWRVVRRLSGTTESVVRGQRAIANLYQLVSARCLTGDFARQLDPSDCCAVDDIHHAGWETLMP
jgi:hypothetical protein